jgi:hypothetical protein
MREEESNQQFEEATKRGRETLDGSPKAKTISYNAKSRRIVIELESGVSAIVPIRLIEILQNATSEQIGDVEIAVGGLYLRWKSLDEDLFVPNLLQGIFGTRRWMNNLKEHLSEAGKKGGASRSKAKRKSSAENGKKGGRPRRKQVA